MSRKSPKPNGKKKGKSDGGGGEILQTPKRSTLPPMASIREYCLMWCDRDGKRYNSKRDVAFCLQTTCPLYPWRSGVLRSRYGGRYLRTTRHMWEELGKVKEKVKREETRVLNAEASLSSAKQRRDKAVKALRAIEEMIDVELQFVDGNGKKEGGEREVGD